MRMFLGTTLTLLAMILTGADSNQFRGPTRDGQFKEKGLAKQWPEEGPKELWSAEGLGQGYSSVAVVGGSIYATGAQGGEGFLMAFDLKGKEKWRSSYGPVHHGSGYPGSRTTPTVDGNQVYLMSSMGRLACYDAVSGKEKWKVETLERFKGADSPEELIPQWGIAESVLIEVELAICTPGGPDATLAAFDKQSGKFVWATKGVGELSGYCSARVFDNGKLRQIVTMTSKSMIGVDIKTGNLLWRLPYSASYGIHAVSPVFQGNYIYVSDGYGQGGTMVELAGDGRSVDRRWKEATLDIQLGGVVLVDGHLYGASNRGKWMCLEMATGQVKKTIEGVGKGAVIFADGMIYGYSERGKMGLFKPGPESFELVSMFRITKGSGQHWAHPVISDGVLYIRRGNALTAFAVR